MHATDYRLVDYFFSLLIIIIDCIVIEERTICDHACHRHSMVCKDMIIQEL